MPKKTMPKKKYSNCPHKWQGLRDLGCQYITGDGQCELQISPLAEDAWCAEMIKLGLETKKGDPVTKYEELMKGLATREQDFKDELISSIKQLPDNPRINRIGNHFEINSADIVTNLSTFYHDFLAQHDMLIRIINHFELQAVGRYIEEILRSGTVRVWGNRERFHPDVVEKLRELWEVEE